LRPDSSADFLVLAELTANSEISCSRSEASHAGHVDGFAEPRTSTSKM
jgi:hypothetical protein